VPLVADCGDPGECWMAAWHRFEPFVGTWLGEKAGVDRPARSSAREGVPLNIIQRRFGPSTSGRLPSTYRELTLRRSSRRAPMMPASAGLQL
jgi:hypothetical protein